MILSQQTREYKFSHPFMTMMRCEHSWRSKDAQSSSWRLSVETMPFWCILSPPRSRNREACTCPSWCIVLCIRKNIIQKCYIEGLIGLPTNVFFGAGIPASIIVIDKEGKDSHKGIFFIDAKNGYMKDGAKNRPREQDIKRIVDAYPSLLPYGGMVRNWEEWLQPEYPSLRGIFLRRIPMVTTPWNRQRIRLAVLLRKIRHTISQRGSFLFGP